MVIIMIALNISFVNTTGDLANDYTVKYVVDSTYYETSKVSTKSIAYAWDKNTNKGHEYISGKVKKQLMLC